MSEDERNEIKRAAAEAVAKHLEISDKDRVKLSIKTAVAICLTIVGATWSAAWVVGSYLNDIRAGQERIESALNYKVSYGQFSEWVTQLDRQNRQTVPSLIVPLPERASSPASNGSH